MRFVCQGGAFKSFSFHSDFNLKDFCLREELFKKKFIASSNVSWKCLSIRKESEKDEILKAPKRF